MNEKHRAYEAFYIIRPDIADDEVQKVADRYRAVVTEHGGEVLHAGKWDKRKLAYEIKGFKEGTYIQMNFTAGAALPAELNRLMRISDDVIRQMILVDEKPKAAPGAASAEGAEPAPMQAAAKPRAKSSEPAADSAPAQVPSQALPQSPEQAADPAPL